MDRIKGSEEVFYLNNELDRARYDIRRDLRDIVIQFMIGVAILITVTCTDITHKVSSPALAIYMIVCVIGCIVLLCVIDIYDIIVIKKRIKDMEEKNATN